MSNSTITLQNIVNLAIIHIDGMPMSGVGGYSNEPALSLCNDVLSDVLFSGIDWTWNRVEMPFLVTAVNKQDYQFGGACAFTLGSTSTGVGIGLASNSAITESGTTVTVTTLEPHRFSVGDTVYMAGNTVAAYNSTFTDDGNSSTWSGGWTILTVPSTTTFTFTHATSGLAASGAPGITDYGWLASASMVQMSSTSSPRYSKTIEAKKQLDVWSRVANPEKVCVLKDNGDGTLKIRFWQVPGSTIWGVYLVYQAKPPLKVALTDTWSPIPDHYSALTRQGFLYRAYRFLDSTKANGEYQKFQQELARANGAADREQTDIHVCPEESLMDSGW